MLSGEQQIRRGFHWVAVMLAALLLALGLVFERLRSPWGRSAAQRETLEIYVNDRMPPIGA